VISHVFTEKKTIWWLKRFNDIKMPLLMANLFVEADGGIESKE
jgi:hypothetical protein